MEKLCNFRRYDVEGRWQMVTDHHQIVTVLPDAGDGLDLDGKFVLPGFIDAHCHILPTGLDLQKLHLGHCETPEQVLDAVRDYEKTMEEGKWCLAVHYDQTKFPGATHLHRSHLDAISSTRPILLRSVNGHRHDDRTL
ncbi:MAG: amidohydrolase family protein [Armatimonadetes bacterium]|nr:amidohydrolase family protein [Armatimonadota bacterium]